MRIKLIFCCRKSMICFSVLLVLGIIDSNYGLSKVDSIKGCPINSVVYIPHLDTASFFFWKNVEFS